MATKKKKSTSIFSAARKQFGDENYGTKQFRRDFNKLVKSGLLKSQKSALPTPTEYALRQIRKFSDVLSGEAQTLKIGVREGKAYREAGYIVKNNTAVVHNAKGSKVRRVAPTDKGFPQFEVITPGKNGKEKVARRVLLPYGDLESYVYYIVNDTPPLKKGEFIGFRFFGNNSIRYWFEPDAKQKLLEYFLRYQSVQQAVDSGDVDEQDEIYANFEVVIFRDQKEWSQRVKEQRGRPSEERNARNRERKREWLKGYLGRMNEEELAYYKLRTRDDKKKAAEKQARYQAKINQSNPDKIAADKLRKAANAKKWRAAKRAAKSTK